MERFTGLVGFFLILLLAWTLSVNRSAIRWRLVGWSAVTGVKPSASDQPGSMQRSAKARPFAVVTSRGHVERSSFAGPSAGELQLRQAPVAAEGLAAFVEDVVAVAAVVRAAHSITSGSQTVSVPARRFH